MFTVVKLWDDEEIVGRIYLQYCLLVDGTRLKEEKREAVVNILWNCMNKLSAVKYHKDNYARIEGQKYKEALRKLRKPHQSSTEAEELSMIWEIEAMLMQTKSSLDMLVKILDPFLEVKKLHTFGKSGDDVIKVLENNVSWGTFNKERVADIVELIKSDKDSWIKKVVSLRDTVSHYNSLKHIRFNGNYYQMELSI